MDLTDIAREIRKDVVCMHRKGSNVGSAMSAVDILVALYFGAMDIPDPGDTRRDRFILSKGHAVAALYATLAQKGFIERSSLVKFLENGSVLAGHPPHASVRGIDVATGSLGHGLPIAVGMGLAAKQDRLGSRVFVLMGCGEMQEGSVWEGAMLAAKLHLDNVVAIVDANGIQGYDRTDEVQPMNLLRGKLEAQGWAVREADGHDMDQLSRQLKEVPFVAGKPSAVVARTVMGKGVAEMEDRLDWHYFNVPESKLNCFLNELDAGQ